jgi:hypothetical protein
MVTQASPPCRTAVHVRAEIAVRHRLVLASAAAGSSVRRLRSSDGAFPAGTAVSGRRLRRRRRRCKWRAGPAAAPSAARNTRCAGALADGEVDRPGSARREQMVTTSPPLRVIVRVRWPCSRPRCSMSAPLASETRRPFSASSEISACSVSGPSRRLPVARRVRCGRARRRETHSPPADDGRARLVSARGVPLRPCTYRTLRWCTVGG